MRTCICSMHWIVPSDIVKQQLILGTAGAHPSSWPSLYIQVHVCTRDDWEISATILYSLYSAKTITIWFSHLSICSAICRLMSRPSVLFLSQHSPSVLKYDIVVIRHLAHYGMGKSLVWVLSHTNFSLWVFPSRSAAVYMYNSSGPNEIRPAGKHVSS